jgi:hypothetical protein
MIIRNRAYNVCSQIDSVKTFRNYLAKLLNLRRLARAIGKF